VLHAGTHSFDAAIGILALLGHLALRRHCCVCHQYINYVWHHSAGLRCTNDCGINCTFQSCLWPADTPNTGETSYMLQAVTILVLAPGQEIKLRAIARKGLGKDHAKWIPVATVVLVRVPDIHINETLMSTLSDEEKQEFVDSCPQKVFGISPVTNAVRCRNLPEAFQLGLATPWMDVVAQAVTPFAPLFSALQARCTSRTSSELLPLACCYKVVNRCRWR
jgi:hypothetical protein